MKNKKRIKNRFCIILIIISIILGGVIGATMFGNNESVVLRHIDSVNFIINDVNVVSTDMQGFCSSRLNTLAPNFNSSLTTICDTKLTDVQSNIGDINCHCYSYNKLIDLPRF
jgi:hypothetical protein